MLPGLLHDFGRKRAHGGSGHVVAGRHHFRYRSLRECGVPRGVNPMAPAAFISRKKLDPGYFPSSCNPPLRVVRLVQQPTAAKNRAPGKHFTFPANTMVFGWKHRRRQSGIGQFSTVSPEFLPISYHSRFRLSVRRWLRRMRAAWQGCGVLAVAKASFHCDPKLPTWRQKRGIT